MNEFISPSTFLRPSFVSNSAWLQHIPFAFWLVEKMNPGILVELGVHSGASYFAFCQSVQENKVNCICYGIDTWVGDTHSGFYGEDVFNNVARFNLENYSKFSYLLRSTFEDSLISFEDQSIDLLHIDGYHTYDAVKKDFESWLSKLSDKAVVLIHDIHVRESEFGVYRLWSELKKDYPFFEFSFGYGLGVLGVGKQLPEEINKLFAISDQQTINSVNNAYARMGEFLILQQHLQQSDAENAAFRTKIELHKHELAKQADLLDKRDTHIKHLEKINEDLYKQNLDLLGRIKTMSDFQQPFDKQKTPEKETENHIH